MRATKGLSKSGGGCGETRASKGKRKNENRRQLGIVAEIGMRRTAHLGRKHGNIGREDKYVVQAEQRRIECQKSRGRGPTLPPQHKRQGQDRSGDAAEGE